MNYITASIRTLVRVTAVLSLVCVLIPAHLTYAQSGYRESSTALSGDEKCGKDAAHECNLITDSVLVFKSAMLLVIYIGLPLLLAVLSVMFVQAYFAVIYGNASAYKELRSKAWSASIGFILLCILFGGGAYTLLQFAGVKEFVLPLIKKLSEALVTHAYAQDAPYLPNPLQSDNFFDLILSILRLVMRFFVYPGLIVMWVWTGFSFVAAQGNPDGLNKAKKFLMWAFVSTIVIVMLQGFLLAVKATVDGIFQKKEQQVQVTPTQPTINQGTLDGRVAPADGTYGSTCITTTGGNGTLGPDGKTCMAGRGAGANNTRDFCTNKAFGTLCIVSGTELIGICNNNFETQIFSCNRAMKGDECIGGNGVLGIIAEDRITCTPKAR